MARRVQALCGIAHYDDAVSQSRLSGENYWLRADFHGKQILNKEFAMLTKAILTGAVLSALAGCIVYFGIEGADAQTGEIKNNIWIDETELAGAPGNAANGVDAAAVSAKDAMVSTKDATASADEEMDKKQGGLTTSNIETAQSIEEEAAAVAPDDNANKQTSEPAKKSKPETKWLDQYLKRTKAKAGSKVKAALKSKENLEAETEEALPKTDMMKPDDTMKADDAGVAKADVTAIRPKIRMKDKGSATRDIEIDIDAIDMEALDLDGDIDIDMLKKKLGLDSEKNVEIRVVKKMKGKASQTKKAKKQNPVIDYDTVLNEAKKLLVVDMRNQAVLEIIDYAVDNKDMAEAADLLEELSTPELRDTARARIGAGLARAGKVEAAFAVIEELEIDELAAPIRLEIITALMATSQERQVLGFRN